MNKSIITTVLGLAALAAPALASAQTEELLPAFPGAEGYGKFVTGGRGGEVYHVTTLEDNNEEGSLRWAVNQPGARTIVFDVSGTIMLQSELKIRNGNVTIAGQTAPGDGICVANFPFTISASNVIIRYMRFRLGNEALKTNNKAHEGDGLGGMDTSKVMIDHCSVSWSIDECLSVYGSRNFTVQWSIVSHSLVNAGHSKGSHGYGGNWGGAGASYHHNLLAHHGSRTPRFGPRQGTQKDERMDYRNNVIYNFGGNGCYGGEGMRVNVVGNYYKPGPTSPSGTKGKRIVALGVRTVDYCLDKNPIVTQYNKLKGTKLVSNSIKGGRDSKGNYISFQGNKCYIDMEKNTFAVEHEGEIHNLKMSWNGWKPMLHVWARMFVDGNYNTKYEDMNADNWKVGVFDQIDKNANDGTWSDAVQESMVLAEPIPFVSTTTHTAEMAYERVVEYAGASLVRDEYDTMIAEETREGTAKFGRSGLIDSQDQITYADGHTGWPTLESTPAPVDTDGDGMPDEWEQANGLDSMDAADGKLTAANGYTNLENYLNSLVAHITEAQNAGGQVLGLADMSGIDDIIVTPSQGTVQDNRTFNIMGVEVKGDLVPGVYIRNGQKFVVK